MTAENIEVNIPATTIENPGDLPLPVEPKAPEEKPEPKGIEDLPLPEEESDGDEEERQTWPKGVAERIKREKDKAAKLAQKAAEADNLRSELERVRSAQQPSGQPTMPQMPMVPGLEPPKRDDFKSDYDYFEAATAFRGKVSQLQSQAEAMQEANNNFYKKWNETRTKGAEKYADFEEVTKPLNQSDFPTNRAMAEAIVESDFKQDILYFLGKYKDKAREIAKMNPVMAVKEITRLEGRFKERMRSTKTNAAPVLKPLGANGGSSGSATNQNPDKMNMTDFKDWYKTKYAK